MQVLAESEAIVPPPPAVRGSERRWARSVVAAREGMLPISGPEEVVQILRAGVSRRYSGELRLVATTGSGQVCLYNGGIAWVQCTTWPEHLGDVLAREAGIGRLDLDRAMDYCRETGGKLGHALVRLGLIDYACLRRCLGLHVAAHLKDLLALDGQLRGRFDFVVDRHYDRALTFALAEVLPSAGAVVGA